MDEFMGIGIRSVLVLAMLFQGWLADFKPANPETTRPVDLITRYHPDGVLRVGDKVSFDLLIPVGTKLQVDSFSVKPNENDQKELGTASFGENGFGYKQASLYWVWDTKDLQPGSYHFTYHLQPADITWVEEVTLYPAESVNHEWLSVTTDCCEIHYISNTEAARDIQPLIKLINDQYQSVTRKMNVRLDQRVVITLISRVLGHGGFAGDEVYISYLDRNYASTELGMVIHHELVHRVDQILGNDYRPSILVEGLAVYLTGGHFKQEALLPRAVTLLREGLYIPMRTLTDNFYPSQHEIGYLQAGALVEYLVTTYGWDSYNAFYRSIKAPEDGKPSTAIDQALQEHFLIGLDDLEDRLIQRLLSQPYNPDWGEDVVLTIQYYDTVREYQQVFDTSAFFQEVWLPSAPEMRKLGIVADYLRHPDLPANQQMESLLVKAGKALRAGNYPLAWKSLHSLNYILHRSTPQPIPGIDEIKPSSRIPFLDDVSEFLKEKPLQFTRSNGGVFVVYGHNPGLTTLNTVPNNGHHWF
jgi:hypothetical protein